MNGTPKQAPAQLTLDLPHRPARGAEDFLVSASNEAALAVVEAWPEWSHRAILVWGPERSGKSHLANVWSALSGATTVQAVSLNERTIATLEQDRTLVIEDIDQGIADERILFHLLNVAREKTGSIFLTARCAPGQIEISLPDLRSRLRALPLVKIEPPDDALLKGLLVKLFTDRQLAVEPHVVNYIALHMIRSTEVAARVVDAADRLSLAQRRKVTRTVAQHALEAVAAELEAE